MLSIRNDRLVVWASEEGDRVILEDLARKQEWTLDGDTIFWGEELSCDNHPTERWQEKLHLLRPVRAEMMHGNGLRVVYLADNTEVYMEYALLDDGIEITLPSCEKPVLACTLPGAFYPNEGEQQLILPIMQGVVWKGAGDCVDRLLISGGHDNFSMQMFGTLGARGGLLYAPESVSDCFWRYAKQKDGHFFAENIQISSLGSMRYSRTMRLYMTDPTIKAISKRYRARVIERGRFRTWEEKIAERPMLERLFGSIMCFIGYCQDDLDYAAEFSKLKRQGFDRALIYPVRMHAYTRGFRMGGEPPIWLSDEQIDEIKALGYDVCPWTWINEAIVDGTAQTEGLFRINRGGEHILGWRIDDFTWDKCCSSRMAEFQREADSHGMSAMTWDHFDVLTCAMIGECYAKDHPAHMGRAMSREEDIGWLRQTLLYGQDGRKVVSSESFNDIFSAEYDMGSVKAFPINWKRPFCVIPLTSLVYHDSILHTWWEPHNYNTHYFNRTCAAGYMEYGGGMPRLMAASDALMGAIPDVFPFGSQYGWTGRGKETYLYKIRFEDPEVQLALKLAKPVADLHRKIGKLEMVDFEILSDDGCVQRSVFADGTSVVANFSNFLRSERDDMMPLGAQSWRVVEGK